MGATNRPQELDEAVLRYMIEKLDTLFSLLPDYIFLLFKPLQTFPEKDLCGNAGYRGICFVTGNTVHALLALDRKGQQSLGCYVMYLLSV